MKNHISVLLSLKDFSPIALEAVKGFLNQTVKPKELIVVGPKKDLQQLQRSLSVKTLNRIKLIEYTGEKNEARNIAFLKATGTHVIFTDKDMVPQKNLLEECEEKIKIFDAIIIPEKGIKGIGIMEDIHWLEKEIVSTDPNALTPRLFKRDLFSTHEKPFDKKYGELDEWGFYIKLKAKDPKMGTVSSFFMVKENMSLFERIKKNFKKGLCIKNLIEENKEEGLRRINPIERGIKIFTKNIKLLPSNPFLFLLLVVFKSIDLFSFYSGYIYNRITKNKA